MAQIGRTPVREGDLLAGKYRVERMLGSGGMGIVVAARHEQLGRLVAIKVVRDDALGKGDSVERFLREARSAASLRSEHVAKVLDVGKLESGAPYMVMEYLDGSDLSQVLAAEGVMAVDTAAMLLLQACEAVAEAHSVGIVHRDLKPENLFLTRTVGGSPRLKVLDFGVSKSMGTPSGGVGLTRTSAMLGSPLYMAPEQMRSSRDVDARADVWALGVVLFELLTQRWPFEADNMPALCLKVVAEAPQPIGAFRPDLPPDLVRIIERCLEKNPTDRYANAAELAAALEPFAPPLLLRVAAEKTRPSFAGTPARPSPTPQPAPGSGSPPFPAPRPTLPSVDHAAAPSPKITPAVWGTPGRVPGESDATSRGRRRALWGGGVLLLALFGAFTSVVVRGRGAGLAAAPGPMTSGEDVAPRAVIPSVSETYATPSAPTVLPRLEVPPATSDSPVASSSSKAPTDSPDPASAPVSLSGTASPPVFKPFAPPRPIDPPAPRRAKVRDDDIPAMR